jgi:oligopeptide transport system substrate-binding protein
VKRIILLIGVILVIVTLATACTPKSSSTTTTSGSTQATPGNGTTSVTPGNGTLNLLDIDPTTLDPAVVSETTSAQYVMELFGGLLKLDENLKPVSDIAQTWDISTDGLTYTFHLNNNVKFQSGKAVKASDFKYSWERAANPATNSQTAATYLGDIVGVNDVVSGKTNQISGVKVVDDTTLQVTIGSPKSYFLYKMTYPTTYVVDQTNVNSGSDWWKQPKGTGPFKLSQWTQGQSLTLVRNDSYYGNLPSLSQVKYQFYTGLPMDLYETGQIDVAGVSTDYKDEVMDTSGPFYQDLSVSPSLGIYYLGFNCTQAPFDDINIRKAFSMAIDKDKIISLIFLDMEKKANGILPPRMPGFNQNLSGIGFDMSQAQQLIKSSKYGDISKLPPITLTTAGYGGSVSQVIQAIVYQWQQNLGVQVKVRQLEPDYYFYNTKTEIDQMFDTAWAADYPHPQDFLDILFHSGSNYNYGNYSNSAADTLIDQANQTADQGQSFALYQQAEQKIVNEAACIPISFSTNYYLVKPYVKGYSINALGFATIDKVSITPH